MYIMKVYLQDHFLKVSFMKFLNYSNTIAHEVEDYLVLPFFLLVLELSVGDSSTKMVTFGAHDRSACWHTFVISLLDILNAARANMSAEEKERTNEDDT